MVIPACLLALSLVAVETPTADEIERRVVEERSRIKSGHIVVDTTQSKREYKQWRKVLDIRFRGDLRRTDERVYYLPGQQPKGEWRDHFVRRRCVAPGLVCDYHDCWIGSIGPKQLTLLESIQVLLETGALPARRANREQAAMWTGAVERVGALILPDPRRVGMDAAPVDYVWFPTYGFPTSSRRDRIEVSEIEHEGLPCWRLVGDFGGTKSRRSSVIVSPSQGYSIRRWEEFSTGRDGVVGTVLEVDVAKHAPSGLWFPSELRFVRIESGEPVFHQMATISVKSFNEPFPPDQLSVESLNIPAGCRVWHEQRRELIYWDGVQYKRSTEDVDAVERVWDGCRIVSPESWQTTARYRGLRRLGWVVIGALALIGASLWIRRRYRLRVQSHSVAL